MNKDLTREEIIENLLRGMLNLITQVKDDIGDKWDSKQPKYFYLEKSMKDADEVLWNE